MQAQHAQVPTYLALNHQGRQYPIQSLKAQESLNAPMWAEVVVDPLPGIAPESLPGKALSICLPGGDGGQRWLHGHVSAARISDVWVLTLHSRLWQGRLLQKSRLFPDLNRRQLVQQLLDEIGYARDQIDWRLDQPHHPGLPPNPLLQASETHLDCFNRLLSEAGWNYWFEDQGKDHECLVISDQEHHLPLNLPDMQLPPMNGSTGVSDINRLVRIGFNAELQNQSAVHSNVLQGNHYQATGRGHWQTFAPPLSPDAAQRRVKQQNQTFEQTIEHHLVSHQPRLQVGQTLAIKPGPLPINHPPISQRLLLLRIEHQAEQLHSDHPGLLSYHNRVTGCCSTRPPYPTPVILPEDHPLVFPAEITGAAGQPQPNKAGQYTFNSFNQTDVRSRYPGLLLRPYAGKKAGWHFPLVGGSRVLITFLNGDPNHPLILGVLPHRNAPGPVTNKNATQHRIITPAQNELTLDDNPTAPCIRLQSLSSDLHLELNAKEGEPFLRMAAHYGVISLNAAVDLYLKATQSTRQKIKEDRTVQVKNNHQTQAEENIHWQSGQHIGLQAKQSLSQTAGETLQLQSGKDIHLTAQKNLTVKTQKGHHIKVPQGSWIKTVNGDITIKSLSGIIIIGNDTAGVKLDQKGIKLYGKTINLKGSTVTFNGDSVDYDPAGSNAPETAPRPESLEAAPIHKLLTSA